MHISQGTLGSSLNINNGCTSLDTLYIKDSKNLGTDAANPFISLGNTSPSHVDMELFLCRMRRYSTADISALEKAGWILAL